MLLLEACREELVLGFRFGYLVFVDDDVSILQGSFKAWHAEMLQWEPAIMIPAFNFVLDERRYKGRPVGVWCYDSFFVAYHRELADALLPLDASLDDVDACWWDSSFYIQYFVSDPLARPYFGFRQAGGSGLDQGHISTTWLLRSWSKNVGAGQEAATKTLGHR